MVQPTGTFHMASLEDQRLFPMMTVFIETLLGMTMMETHEELMQAGMLVEFRENMGNWSKVKEMFDVFGASQRWIY